MFDFKALLPDNTEKNAEDYARGWSVASVAAPTIERMLREAWPGETDAFYNGIIMGLRDEL